MDSERALRTEFRRALDDVLPPAPWLSTRVRERLHEERRKRLWRMGPGRPSIVVQLPRFSQRVAAAALITVLAAAALGVFLMTHRQANQSVPAGLTPPKAMPSGTQDLKAGTYALAVPGLDAPGKPFPHVVITVPGGWSVYQGFAVEAKIDTPRYLAVSFWSVGDVYANSCHWFGHTIAPGPTVDDLASVLAARPLRNATTPMAVSLGGYHGKYLVWSVPTDIAFSDCDGGRFNSWIASNGGDRYQQGPGQVDMLWILDIGGSRLVIDATFLPGATEPDRAELANVVNSIEFRS